MGAGFMGWNNKLNIEKRNNNYEDSIEC